MCLHEQRPSARPHFQAFGYQHRHQPTSKPQPSSPPTSLSPLTHLDQDITPSNRTDLLARRALALADPPSWGPYFGPCSAVHPWLDSCLNVPSERFWEVFKWMFPIYGALHLIPMVLFKRNTIMKDPAYMLVRAGWGTARSSAFLSVFIVIYQCEFYQCVWLLLVLTILTNYTAFFCWKHNAWLTLTALRSSTSRLHSTFPLFAFLAKLIPQQFIDFLLSKPSFWLGGLLSGLSLFVEEARRRPELAMYVLPKGLESAWVMARGKRLVPRTGQYGEAVLSAIGMGMVMVSGLICLAFKSSAPDTDFGLFDMVCRVYIRMTLNICLGLYEGYCTSLLALIDVSSYVDSGRTFMSSFNTVNMLNMLCRTRHKYSSPHLYVSVAPPSTGERVTPQMYPEAFRWT